MNNDLQYLKQRFEELGRPPLTGWGRLAEKYWRENLPSMWRGLKAGGVLREAVILAQENAKDRLAKLVEEGTNPWAAQEIAMKEFLYLDPEPETNSLDPAEESEGPLEDLANEQTATSAVEEWINDAARGTLRFNTREEKAKR